MKKHPVLTTILLLLCLIIGFGLIMKALMGPMSSSSGIAFTNKIGVIPVIRAIEDSTDLLKQITT
ncbi:MAG: hypothetical protein GX846_09760, partial [Deltaproteobacteria bacterium]|nr:hypothetical protein [Deltaproteobacteria bacterium]